MDASFEHMKKYWAKRSSSELDRTVGFHAADKQQQDKIYTARKDFIFQYCPRDLRTVDYGCGIGRYAQDFNHYLGIDITRTLLSIAKDNNPEKEFILLEAIEELSGVVLDLELFFTATVLQHNSDEVILEILRAVQKAKSRDFWFCLYENSFSDNWYIQGRDPLEYLSLISRVFVPVEYSSYLHTIHEEKHSLTLVRV